MTESSISNPRNHWFAATGGIALVGALSFTYLDIPTALWFRQFNDTAFHQIFKLVSRFGESQWYLAGGLLLYVAMRSKRPGLSATGLLLSLSVAISGLLTDILKVVLGRARPKLFFREALYGFDFLHFEPAWLSFPSGHSATAFSVAATIWFAAPPYRIYALLWATLIAFSRIALTQHYISDVLFGSLLGAATTALLYNRYFRNPSHACIPGKIP